MALDYRNGRFALTMIRSTYKYIHHTTTTNIFHTKHFRQTSKFALVVRPNATTKTDVFKLSLSMCVTFELEMITSDICAFAFTVLYTVWNTLFTLHEFILVFRSVHIGSHKFLYEYNICNISQQHLFASDWNVLFQLESFIQLLDPFGKRSLVWMHILESIEKFDSLKNTNFTLSN